MHPSSNSIKADELLPHHVLILSFLFLPAVVDKTSFMSSPIPEAPYPNGHPLSTTRSPANGMWLLCPDTAPAIAHSGMGAPQTDPHSLPSFLDTDAVIKPSRTVLYLPPLLSALCVFAPPIYIFRTLMP